MPIESKKHILYCLNKRWQHFLSSISTKSKLTFYPRQALPFTLTTMINIVSSIGALPITAKLSESALVPAPSTVILVTKNVPAMLLATEEQAGSIVCRNPIADVVTNGITSCTLFYDIGQEPTSHSMIW